MNTNSFNVNNKVGIDYVIDFGIYISASRKKKILVLKIAT